MQPIILVLTFSFLLVWLIISVYVFRKQLTNMAGMTIAMTLGMSVGLSIGTLVAILYSDLFFEVTMFSMLFAGMIGILSGFPFSYIAILDGFMSGIMGG